MNDEQLLRYSRHILLEDWGVEGQQRLAIARALIIGAGGLGSPVALYLASAGVGHITLVDHDRVDLTNLQRQIAHQTSAVGQFKAESAAQRMGALNPEIRIEAVVARVDTAWLDAQVPQHQVVLDCTDNFTTRQAVNRACVQHRVPLVSGAAIGYSGQVSVYDRRRHDHPCYACVFPADRTVDEANCATMGVFAPLVGIIGTVQAAEALKLLAGVGQSLAGRLLMLDARQMEWTEVQVPAQAGCAVCNP